MLLPKITVARVQSNEDVASVIRREDKQFKHVVETKKKRCRLQSFEVRQSKIVAVSYIVSRNRSLIIFTDLC